MKKATEKRICKGKRFLSLLLVGVLLAATLAAPASAAININAKSGSVSSQNLKSQAKIVKSGTMEVLDRACFKGGVFRIEPGAVVVVRDVAAFFGTDIENMGTIYLEEDALLYIEKAGSGPENYNNNGGSLSSYGEDGIMLQAPRSEWSEQQKQAVDSLADLQSQQRAAYNVWQTYQMLASQDSKYTGLARQAFDEYNKKSIAVFSAESWIGSIPKTEYHNAEGNIIIDKGAMLTTTNGVSFSMEDGQGVCQGEMFLPGPISLVNSDLKVEVEGAEPTLSGKEIQISDSGAIYFGFTSTISIAEMRETGSGSSTTQIHITRSGNRRAVEDSTLYCSGNVTVKSVYGGYCFCNNTIQQSGGNVSIDQNNWIYNK